MSHAITSSTPRTDAALLPKYTDGSGMRLELVPASFARHLEMELARWKAIAEKFAEGVSTDCEDSVSWKVRHDALEEFKVLKRSP